VILFCPTHLVQWSGRAGNRNKEGSQVSEYVKIKPSTIDCEICGAVVPVKQGRGRRPKFCADCKSAGGAGDGVIVVVESEAERRKNRPSGPHPLVLARIAKNGPGRARAHRPLGIKAESTAGKVPHRAGSR